MNPEVQTKFDGYPDQARNQLINIRQLIFSVAEENGLGPVEESLKWGEPSYVVKGGSAIRIDWKQKTPDFIKVYFHCQTSLVETFREIYGDDFDFEGNRALMVPLNVPVRKRPLKHCIALALKYHKLKHLPLLGL